MALETELMDLLMKVFSLNSEDRNPNVFRFNTAAQSKESYSIQTDKLTAGVHKSRRNTEVLNAIRRRRFSAEEQVVL